MSKSCNECRYAVMVDYGYSNYTVEGTNVYCAQKLHPNDGFDHWYGENEYNKFAEQCQGFTQGSPVMIDVDGEAHDGMSEDEREIYHMAFPK